MFLTKRLFLGALALSLMSWTSYSYKSLANSQLSTESLQKFSTKIQVNSPQKSYKFSLCPTNLRVINAAVGTASPIDVIVNGKKILENVDFRQASKYVDVAPGNIEVLFVRSGTRSTIAYRTFTGAPNSAYTVAITGTLQGPSGQPLFNQSPFVIPEDLTQPNPGKFKGRWYRFSETSAVIDFRISKSSSPNVDETRLTDLRDFQRINHSKKNKRQDFSRMIIIFKGEKRGCRGQSLFSPHLCMKNLYTCRLL